MRKDKTFKKCCVHEMRKLISCFLSIVIVMTVCPFINVRNASAICCCKDNFDKSKYTLTGNMAEDVATIAKSQAGRTCDQFGYKDADYGAWCDEFCADCIENAGADSSIVGHGGTVADFENVMRKKGAVTDSTPHVGDLVFFTWSHVEIVTKVENGVVYCAGGNNGARPGFCRGERKLSSVGSYRLFLKPNYPGIIIPPVPDPNPDTELGIPYSRPSGTPYIKSGSKGNDVGWLQCALNKAINAGLTVDCDFGAATKSAVTKFQSANGLDVDGIVGPATINKLVEVIKIIINPPAPPANLHCKTDKEKYAIGEKINFSFSADNSNETYVLIDANGVRVEPWANVTGKTTYSCSFSTPGNYVYRLYTKNSIGENATEWQSFTVYEGTPSGLSIKCDKSSYAVGNTINFEFSSNNANEAYVLIDANGVRVEPWANVTGKTTYSCSFSTPGNYVYRLYTKNSIGENATEWKSFTVYNDKPSNLEIISDKTSILQGESVTFKYSIQNSNESCIGIDKNGTRYKTIPVTGSSGEITNTFNEPGNYCVIIEGSNPYGYTCCKNGIFINVNEILTSQSTLPVKQTSAGDTNLDGKVDISDVVTVRRYVANSEKNPLSEQALSNADVVGNNGVNAQDAVAIMQSIFGLISL